MAAVLLPSAYMFSPAVGHLLTRLLTGEGWSGMGLRPRWNRRSRRALLLAWLLPVAVTVVGALVYFAAFPQVFDPSLAGFRAQLAAAERAAGQPIPVPFPLLVVLQVASALLIAPLVNTVFAAGEELGWRGYLLPKLLQVTGPRRALVGTGIVWGVWHWPLIVMGYQYGLGYRGAPWPGLLLFCVFTVATGTVLSWLAIRGGSVWPAALGHGSINAWTGLPLIVTAGQPSLLLGPMTIGAVAMLPWVALAGVLLATAPRWATSTPGRGAP